MISKRRAKKDAKKIIVGIAGGAILLLGIVAIPYPGPGWIIVFIGLGILATEFSWAKRLLSYTKHRYEMWQKWLSKQPWWIKTLVFIGVSLITIITIWLLNGYGLIADFFNLKYSWLKSPLF